MIRAFRTRGIFYDWKLSECGKEILMIGVRNKYRSDDAAGLTVRQRIAAAPVSNRKRKRIHKAQKGCIGDPLTKCLLSNLPENFSLTSLACLHQQPVFQFRCISVITGSRWLAYR